MGWAENAVYCKTTQVLKIDEHALAKSKNEQFRLVVTGKTVNFGINSFSGGTNSFKIKNYRSRMNWQADEDRFYITFLNGDLYFSAVFPRSATFFHIKAKQRLVPFCEHLGSSTILLASTQEIDRLCRVEAAIEYPLTAENSLSFDDFTIWPHQTASSR